MRAFLTRYYEKVDEFVGDPHTSRRLTTAKKLEQLVSVEQIIWERLLKVCGSESLIGHTTATITFENNKDYYPLPGNFRQFISLQKREVISGRTSVTDTLNSIPFTSLDRGVQILSGQRGMIRQPAPSISADEDWTLTYLKGPIVGHNATAESVGDKTIRLGTPGTDGGEVVKVDDYYKGSMLRVFSATTGAPQAGEVIAYDSTTGACQMRHAWNPKPTGDVQYEFAPEIPIGYDDIYAVTVAIDNMPKRNQQRRMKMLRDTAKMRWEACRSYFASNVADRPPTRMIHHTDDDSVDPYHGSS